MPEPAWDFPAHYRARCAQIREGIAALPEGAETVVLLGDSISEGHPAQQLGGFAVVNQGISGDQIDMPDRPGGGVLRRIELAIQARPVHLFLLIGINDFGDSKPLNVAVEQYLTLVAALRDGLPWTRLALQSVLPTRDAYSRHLPIVRAMNSHIHGIASQCGADYLDLFQRMADAQGYLHSEFTNDGLHLTKAGYAAWTEILERTIGVSTNGESESSAKPSPAGV